MATLSEPEGRIVGIDRDSQSLAVARSRLAERDVSTTFFEGDFRTAAVRDGLDALGLDALGRRLNDEAVRVKGVTRGRVLYGASGRVPVAP